MKLTLSNSERDIPVYNMKDGDIGIITRWGEQDDEIGSIVQRYKDVLISLGEASGSSWTEIFRSLNTDCRVRLLNSGDIINIE